MFTSARLKITAWYLIVIMVICIGFSLVIFQISHSEILRFAKLRTFQAREVLLGKGIDLSTQQVVLSRLEDELILEAKLSLKKKLYGINIFIFVLASIGGYALAGMTLRPIRRTLSEREQFVSDVSHELRTPLTAMKTSLEVALRNKKLDQKQVREVLEGNLIDVNSLQELVESMLMLMRTAKPQLELSKVKLGTMIDKCEKKLEKPLSDAELILDGNYKKHSESLVPKVLEQVLLILLDNACKFAKTDTVIEVNYALKNDTQSIIVKNYGEGIKSKNLAKVGERFFQEDSSRSGKGHGLGLAIAKKLIESIDGELLVRGEEGKWVEFEVRVGKS